MNDEEVKVLCENVYIHMKEAYRKNLDKWCLTKVSSIFQRILDRDLSDKPFLDIMLLSYDELEKLVADPTVINLDYKFSIKSNRRIKGNRLISIKDYLINNVYNAISKDSRRKKILSITHLSVCPYCNRNFMNSSTNKNTCELDHFWNKSQFPIFVASFYNLIPSCPSCNRNKGTETFLLSPYNVKISSNQRLRFSWYPLDGNFLFNRDSIYISSKTHKDFKNDFDLLDLQNLYQIHSDLILDIILKKIFIPEYYLNEINNIIPLSDSDTNRLFTGVYTDEKDYHKRPLSKLISDIYVELNHLER
ncbi:HNH endonuclease [Streptococcus sp. CSL7591-lung]|uniref:HNH endonuclease n=1 Tax=Streptococcus pacificus TaxID=2740577 RepID=A0ABS0ZGW8_9STRE|nr:HNH endonuclease [Streptococcus pacificus]